MQNKLAATLLLLSTLNFQLSTCLAQGTAFTYQGRLNDGANPANGRYDFRFKLYNDPDGSFQVGASYLTNAVPAGNGLFTTTIDFGAGIFIGGTNWLEVGVRTNGGGSYTVLSPLQNLTPTPNAIFAETASNLTGVLPAAQLGGTLLNSSLPTSPNFSGTVSAASYTGNGANLTNVNAVTLGGLNATAFWNLGGNNVAAGQFLGSTNNQAVEIRVNGQRALLLEPNTNGAPNVIGGSPLNVVTPGVFGAMIGGGGGGIYIGENSFNSVSTIFGTIGGGTDNHIETNSPYATIGGGTYNRIQNSGYGSTIVGGSSGMILSSESTIGGGFFNQILIDSSGSMIGGGWNNQIQSGSKVSTIGGGQHNAIQTNASNSTISGGFGNQVGTNAGFATVGGGIYSYGLGAGSTIGGGGTDGTNYFGNTAGGAVSVVGGGMANLSSGFAAFVGGGSNNIIAGNFGTIGGGFQNFVSGDFNGAGDSATVAGGYQNSALGNNAAVGGGVQNLAQGDNATVAGGNSNTNTASHGAIGGGLFNVLSGNFGIIGGGVANGVQATYSVIGGGLINLIQSNANYATIGGGNHNTNLANASYATIPGGNQNSATNYAFAAGNRAKAITTGAFVWADSQSADFASTASDQFLLRAQGGVGIGKNNPATALDVNGTVTANGFAGNGAALISLNAGNLTSGIVPLAVLPAALVTNNETGVTLNGSFSGSGTGLTSLNAANLSSGTLADARLSANVALLAGAQTFTGVKTFTSEAVATGGVRINNTNLWFKGDNQHGLGWYGSGRPFAGNSTIDGPVLFGFSGGALATEQFGTEHLAVQWTPTTVTVNGTFNNNSDRNAKEHFTAISSAEILAKVSQLPLAEWSYKADADTRHIGPMAQDFYSAFNVGTDDKHIAPIDEGGVALAAIQGLNEKVEAGSQKAEGRIQKLEAENSDLKTRLEKLEYLLNHKMKGDNR